MRLKLRAGLSWCLCNDRVVLLDVAADRYFLLAPDLVSAFLEFAGDGPDAIPERERLRLEGLGLLVQESEETLGPTASAPAATHDLLGSRSTRTGAMDLCAVVYAQWKAAWRLRALGLQRLLGSMRERGPARSAADPQHRAIILAEAFERSSLVLKKADRCLPRALAAWSLCRRDGLDAVLVFGVRLEPFSAHSWVQLGDAVIVGDFEQVRLNTPILVAR
jgi:hypothetical protein